MREIELKIPDIDPQDVRERLRRLGARKLGGPTLYKEVFFKLPREGKTPPASFRLRKEGTVTAMTVKRRLPGKGFKFQHEEEVHVSDFERTKRILEMLGFRAFRTREKYREEFKWRNVKIELDSYPRMRPYLEAEATDPRAIEEFLSAMHIPRERAVTWTATELIERRGLDPDRLVFGSRVPKKKSTL